MRTHHEDTAHQIFGEYRWRTFEPYDLSLNDGTLEEAAEAMDLDQCEVEWAIEKYGRCDSLFPTEPRTTIVCWKPGEPEQDADKEPSGGGWEWPITEAPTEDQVTDGLIRRDLPSGD